MSGFLRCRPRRGGRGGLVVKSRRFDRAARLVFFDGRHSRSAWLLRRTVLGPIALLTALSLISQLGPPMPRSPESVVRLDESHIRRVSGPAPSGADPIYPPNHTLDGKVESLGAAPNADFEAPSVPVGSPPTNSDLEAPAVDVVTVPNGDFEAGTFANWTTRSEEHTSELQSPYDLVCRLLLEKKK